MTRVATCSAGTSSGHVRRMVLVALPREPDRRPSRGFVIDDDLGFVSPKRFSALPRVRSAKRSPLLRSSVVIARESGRSSNRHRAADLLLSCFIPPRSIVPGEPAPGRCGGMPPDPRGRSADRRWCGTPHPVARLTAKPVPPTGGISRPITRTGAPIGASPRRFSLDLETAFWKRTGAAIRNALDSAGFHPRSSASTSPLPDGPM
jgi:hypothetical protein